MNFTTLINSSHTPLHQHQLPLLSSTRSLLCTRPSSTLHFLRRPKKQFTYAKKLLSTASCISSEIPRENELDNKEMDPFISSTDKGEEEEEEEGRRDELVDQSLLNQMKEIAIFAGPATGLWICGPLMSLIDTAVIGQGSSIELAALGPGTVLCDYMSYVFMFLSIATSNMVATALAREDKNEVQHHISILLFIGLTCGFLMILFTKFFGTWALSAFTGAKNAHLVPAANTYVQIRGLAWPAVLVGWVAQSASLGMKDSWGPLKALAAASAVNGIGDVVLCILLGYGISGAAWATMASQIVAACLMISALNKKGYNAFALAVPSPNELLSILRIATPVFVMIMSKVSFYIVLIYFATSMGTITMAAHQVLLQTFMMCSVWGEPLSQTAQSFMPALIYGVNRSLAKARVLFRSLILIGVIVGAFLAFVATGVLWCFPHWFTTDQSVVKEIVEAVASVLVILSSQGTCIEVLYLILTKVLCTLVLIPFFVALCVTPTIVSLEGTLMAGRDLKYISASMSGCFTLGALLVMLLSNKGFGLPGCWFALVGFQWTRVFLALRQLTAPNSIINAENLSHLHLEKLKAA